MKKNSIFFCTFAALAMLFASCKGGGGGDSSSSSETQTNNVEGVWICETKQTTDILGTPISLYVGFYLTGGKAYAVISNDKITAYYGKDAEPDATYTVNGNEITWSNNTKSTITGGDTTTINNITVKKSPSIKAEGITDEEYFALLLSWMTPPPSP